MRVLVGFLLAACVLGWGFAIAEGVKAARYRRDAKRTHLELGQAQSATGLFSELTQRVGETQRRIVKLDLERADVQARVYDLRRQLREAEAAGHGKEGP